MGHIGSEVKTIDKENLLFVAFSMATNDTYLDEQNQPKEAPAVWHRVLVFDKTLIPVAQAFNKGDHVEVNGRLSYRPIEPKEGNNQPFRKMEASIIAHTIEAKPQQEAC